MDYKLELVVVPVADVDRAKAFYSDRMGFTVDVDHSAGDDFRIVQMTPHNSGCSIIFGKGGPNPAYSLLLAVDDTTAAHLAAAATTATLTLSLPPPA